MIKTIKLFSKHSVSIAVFLIALINSHSIINANEILFSDDFDSDNSDQWEVQRNKQWSNPTKSCEYNSVPTTWNIKDNKYGIEIEGSPCVTETAPKDLEIPINVNYKLSFDWFFKHTNHADRNVVFKWVDENNWYGLKILDNKIEIQKVVDGKSVFSFPDTYLYDFESDKEYFFEIFVVDENITVLINNESIITVQDSSPILGNSNIALQASVGSISSSFSYFDNILVTSISDELPVPEFKQTDPEWGDHIYDTAESWSTNPTIARYGCATSSVAMILNYHGIDQFKDGTAINPDTLNSWLNTQNDGYIGEGLINWYAVTRLTRELSDHYGTPKLEYAKITEDSYTSTIEEIEAERPAILQIDGHFLVANGILNQGTDIAINDPFYDYDSFSEHNKELLSARMFTPSYTDLSNIVIYHEPNVFIEIADADGNTMAASLTDEYIIPRGDNPPETTKRLSETTISKPSDGIYTISVSQSTYSPYSFDVFSYDIEGNVSVSKVTGYVGSDGESVALDFNKESESSIRDSLNWNYFLDDLDIMAENDRVSTIVKRIRRIVNHRNFYKRKRFETLLTRFMKRYIQRNAELFTTDELDYLLSELKKTNSV